MYGITQISKFRFRVIYSSGYRMKDGIQIPVFEFVSPSLSYSEALEQARYLTTGNIESVNDRKSLNNLKEWIKN